MGTANTVLVVFLVVAAVLAVYLVIIYNNLVTLKNNVARAWANIDVLLKQRHDEMPKLVETCKQYMRFEQDTLERVMQARSPACSRRAKRRTSARWAPPSGAARQHRQAICGRRGLSAAQGQRIFLQLQGRITGLENAIADRREFYNDSVNLYNTRIQQFPDSVIARQFGFKDAEAAGVRGGGEERRGREVAVRLQGGRRRLTFSGGRPRRGSRRRAGSRKGGSRPRSSCPVPAGTGFPR